MSQRPRRKAFWIVFWALVGICVALLFVNRYQTLQAEEQATAAASTTTAQPTGKLARYKYELANEESAQKDSLSADSVNLERLRQRIQSHATAPQEVPPPPAVDTAPLDAAINSVMSQNPDIIFGVAIKDLSTGATYHYGNDAAMTAASVTKVLTATYYLHQVELGNRSLETVMANGQTAQANIEDMIVVSDNDSWHLLNENLGYSNMQNYAHSLGLTSYDYTNNAISSGHTMQLFGDLYERKLINEPNTQLLLSYMERANYRDLIIPAVPPHDTAYHKAGEYLINLNDAAIITNGTTAVVLSIYTESTGTYSKPRVASLMQQITTPTLQTFKLN